MKKLKKQLLQSTSYQQWKELAQEHDRKSGLEHWKQVDRTSLYDYATIRTRLERLRYFRSTADHHGMLFTLDEGIHGNMGGMGRPILCSRARFGTKNLMRE